jgi:hypothetical protein
VQSSIICKCNLGSHKKRKFYLAPKIHNLLYTPIANENFVWDVLCIDNFFPTIRNICISNVPWFVILPKYKKIKFVPLVGLDNTLPTCWGLGPRGFKSWWSMYLVQSKVDCGTNQTKTRKMSHHLLNRTNKKTKKN